MRATYETKAKKSGDIPKRIVWLDLFIRYRFREFERLVKYIDK